MLMEQNYLDLSTNPHFVSFPGDADSITGLRYDAQLRPNDTGITVQSTETDAQTPVKQKEYTGGSVSYYRVPINHPTSGATPYVAECNDIIEALGMNYAEGNAFKAIWRSCAARNLGVSKAGYKDGLYDAEKVVFFGKRMVEQAKNV